MVAIMAIPGVAEAGESSRLRNFCRARLSSLARVDQRRWGEIYVRGLASVPGRKSIRRICDYVVGARADQSLQQFINQSTWKWEPVRHSLAQHVSELIRPRAWVVLEVVFPKNGSSSVGVARQYAPASGRMLNCQVALAVFLVGDTLGCPVNWRLVLPRCWDTDRVRRVRAHLPDAQRHWPRWHYVVDAIDEMRTSWHLSPAPVLLDVTNEQDIAPQLRSLEERGLQYVMQVSPSSPIPSAGSRPSCERAPTAGELATLAVRPGANPLIWQTFGSSRAAVSRIVATRIPRSPDVPASGPWRTQAGSRHLLAEWPSGRNRPNAVWLTNVGDIRLPEMIDLLRSRAVAAEHLRRLENDVGLQHFEGRSFPGWHHHVTLASVAYAYTLGFDGAA